MSIPIAVALEYDGENAPIISAKGVGSIAEKIMHAAKLHGVPLQQDNELIAILADSHLGDEVPENLYVAVAEVIAFAYILSGKFPENWR